MEASDLSSELSDILPDELDRLHNVCFSESFHQAPNPGLAIERLSNFGIPVSEYDAQRMISRATAIYDSTYQTKKSKSKT
ncbi:hypothetical protein M422DRAFT_29527 [Sphaerobolus stellatus SS14]|uniref:Unplaced genomic scaffold SPHSTscaffold_35, whole genome shotgun sequence n=1 Tax=Sphaerobolus stellatus (strain SS14) TaxID=990650 RepID=A0A0C9W3Q7_SPHS4|nr:hypothetical protein M422DRAFT_29527 [Sphaerobolus stellatus SS14]